MQDNLTLQNNPVNVSPPAFYGKDHSGCHTRQGRRRPPQAAGFRRGRRRPAPHPPALTGCVLRFGLSLGGRRGHPAAGGAHTTIQANREEQCTTSTPLVAFGSVFIGRSGVKLKKRTGDFCHPRGESRNTVPNEPC